MADNYGDRCPVEPPQHELNNGSNQLHNQSNNVLEEVLGHELREEADDEEGECSVPLHTAAQKLAVEAQQAMEEDELRENKSDFEVGDHVYEWCSLIGIPGVFQHHGIVIQVANGQLTIADFNGLISASSGDAEQYEENELRRELPGGKKMVFPFSRSVSSMREYTIEESQEGTKWKKVRYNAGWLQRSVWRSGTCTASESDPPGLVLARVQFLLENQHHLPPYHIFKANCECVAVWCKTGTWATLQASSLLEITAAGQVKSATTVALYASSQTVTVPAAGMWGWLGFTTKASLLSTQPLLLPALVGYGVLSIGGPVWMLHRCKSAWNETSTRLHDAFWANANDRPEVFVECITHWSSF